MNRHQSEYQDREKIKEEALKKIKKSALALEQSDMLFFFIAVDISGNGLGNYTLCSKRVEEVVATEIHQGLAARLQSQACKIVKPDLPSRKQKYATVLHDLINPSTGKSVKKYASEHARIFTRLNISSNKNF